MTSPFGIEIGGSVPAGFDKIDEYFWMGATAPAPHRAFEGYGILWTPSLGVAKVVAWSRVFESDNYGTKIREEYARIRAQLVSKYGAPKDFDFLKIDALFQEERYWTLSFIKDERFFSSFWSRPAQNLPPDLEGIHLGLEVYEGHSLRIYLGYTSPGWSIAQDDMELAEGGVL